MLICSALTNFNREARREFYLDEFSQFVEMFERAYHLQNIQKHTDG